MGLTGSLLNGSHGFHPAIDPMQADWSALSSSYLISSSSVPRICSISHYRSHDKMKKGGDKSTSEGRTPTFFCRRTYQKTETGVWQGQATLEPYLQTEQGEMELAALTPTDKKASKRPFMSWRYGADPLEEPALPCIWLHSRCPSSRQTFEMRQLQYW